MKLDDSLDFDTAIDLALQLARYSIDLEKSDKKARSLLSEFSRLCENSHSSEKINELLNNERWLDYNEAKSILDASIAEDCRDIDNGELLYESIYAKISELFTERKSQEHDAISFIASNKDMFLMYKLSSDEEVRKLEHGINTNLYEIYTSIGAESNTNSSGV